MVLANKLEFQFDCFGLPIWDKHNLKTQLYISLIS